MGETVVIIDADEAFASALAEHLESMGVEASTTSNAKVGLDRARINTPHAIIVSVELPTISGYSLCSKIKRDDTLGSVPVVMVSSDASPETFEQHSKLKLRAQAYLRKPIAPAQVASALTPFFAYAVNA